MSKTICIYHKNCWDGICAAWIFQKRFPNCELLAMNYGDEFPFSEYGKNDRVFILDFSFKRSIMEAIRSQVESLFVIDHHKTAQAECEGLDYCLFDMNESGASLSWKYFFHNRPIPLIVRYIRAADIWDWDSVDNGLEITSWIRSYPQTIDTMENLNWRMTNSDSLLSGPVREGESIKRYISRLVESICANAIIKPFGKQNEFNIPQLNATVLISEIGNELCRQHPQSPFSATYFIREYDNKMIWSLRSIGDFDVSVVAKQFGGGGHKNAAGFQEDL